MTMEMMGETMDEAMEGENDEVEEQAIVSQILDEIGIDASQLAPDAPRASPMAATPAADEAAAASPVPMGAGGGGGAAEDPAVSELEARLNNLRRT